MTVSAVILTHRIDSVQCSLYQYDHLSNENCYYGSSECQKIRWKRYLREPARHVQFPSEWLLFVRKTNERQYLQRKSYKMYITAVIDSRKHWRILQMTAADHLHYFRSLSPLLGSWAGGQLWCHATILYNALLLHSTRKCVPWCGMVRHAANDAPKCAMPVKHRAPS